MLWSCGYGVLIPGKRADVCELEPEAVAEFSITLSIDMIILLTGGRRLELEKALSESAWREC